MKTEERTNGLVIHKESNPYEGKIFIEETFLKDNTISESREIEINSPAELRTVLDSLSQFNKENNTGDNPSGIIKRLRIKDQRKLGIKNQ